MTNNTARRSSFLICAVLLAGSTIVAHARPDVRDMTCREARALVRDAGAIVLTTGQHTYNRFVAGHGYCDRGLFLERAWVRTRDRRSCQIGYSCSPVDPYGWDD